MKFDYVSIEKRDGVAIVRFDRKANLNAFNEKRSPDFAGYRGV